MTIGILAYGSLIPNPGAEIAAVTVDRITGVETPFRIEFSRSSRVRDGAPTLVPVKRGGAGVSGVVLVLHDSVGETAAQDMLYRRERNRVGSGDVYADVDETNIDSAFLGRLDHFADLRVVFHAAFRANIEEPTPEMLARLASPAPRRPPERSHGMASATSRPQETAVSSHRLRPTTNGRSSVRPAAATSRKPSPSSARHRPNRACPQAGGVATRLPAQTPGLTSLQVPMSRPRGGGLKTADHFIEPRLRRC